MILILSGLVLLIAVIALWAGLFNQNNKKTTIVTNANEAIADNRESVPNPLTLAKDGIEVTIDQVRKENGQTIIDLSLNNHIYDLSTFTIEERSSLAGQKPSDYQMLNAESGGHHLQAIMTFTGELSGQLIVGLTETINFTFNIQ